MPQFVEAPEQAALAPAAQGQADPTYVAQMPQALEPERPVAERPVFRDPRPLQKWLVGLLVAFGGIVALSICQDFVQIRVIDAILTRGFAEVAAEAEASDARQQMVGWAFLAVFIPTLIVFGIWIYQVATNARAISAERFAIPPGWAVGAYFIPIVNLWIPYRAMSEIWRASRNPTGWRNDRAGGFLGWWWAVWVVSNLAGNVTWRYISEADTLEEIRQASHISIVSELLTVASVVLGVLLVKRLTAYQMQASTGEAIHRVFE